jgi:hypothetical protein
MCGSTSNSTLFTTQQRHIGSQGRAPSAIREPRRSGSKLSTNQTRNMNVECRSENSESVDYLPLLLMPPAGWCPLDLSYGHTYSTMIMYAGPSGQRMQRLSSGAGVLQQLNRTMPRKTPLKRRLSRLVQLGGTGAPPSAIASATPARNFAAATATVTETSTLPLNVMPDQDKFLFDLNGYVVVKASAHTFSFRSLATSLVGVLPTCRRPLSHTVLVAAAPARWRDADRSLARTRVVVCACPCGARAGRIQPGGGRRGQHSRGCPRRSAARAWCGAAEHP